MLDEQFPSNVYIWRKLAEENGASVKVVKREGQASWTDALLAAIGPQTGLVACSQTHWVDGGFIDLPQISDALAPHGGELVLDLSQSLGVQPIDLDRIKPAFAVAVGYKWLMGPYALSYMYVRPDKQIRRAVGAGVDQSGRVPGFRPSGGMSRTVQPRR